MSFYDTLPGNATVRSGAKKSSDLAIGGQRHVGWRGDLKIDAVADDIDPAGGAQKGDAR